MPHKLNISDKGKSWKLEVEETILSVKAVGDKFNGKDVKPELEGYELEIMGGSDKSGFPISKDVEGIGLKKVLLKKGWGMHKRPKGDKKKVPQSKGLRLRKTVRGKVISDKTAQINIKVIKEGNKKLEEIFPEQNKPKEKEKKEAPAEAPAQEKKEEQK
jgi:small subunit ribosomal protein S6e